MPRSYPSRGGQSHIEDAGQVFRIIPWSIGRPLAKTKIAAACDMIDPIRSIPRGSLIPFVVCVKGKEVARRIEIQTVRIAKATRKNLPHSSLRISPSDITGRNPGIIIKQKPIPKSGPKSILGNVPQRRFIGYHPVLFRNKGVVAMNHIDQIVRAKG